MDTPRSLDELIEALADEKRERAADMEAAVTGDNALGDVLGLLKDAIQQDIGFMHELAMHIAARP